MRKYIVPALAAIAIALLTAAAALAHTGASPSVTSIAFASAPSANNTYGRHDRISVLVNFSQRVTASAPTPAYLLGFADPLHLDLTVGTTTRQAQYQSGSGSQTLRFYYVVQDGDLDADGVSIVSNSLSGCCLNGAEAGGRYRHSGITNAAGHKVDGGPFLPPPSFPAAATIASQTFVKGAAVSLTLPAATGTAPLTYTLTAPPLTMPQLPPGLVFDAITRTLAGTTTGWQTSIRYGYTVTDANQKTAWLPVDIAVNADFDADDDQLIEVHNLAQLDAIRWDLDGNGNVTNQSSTDQFSYRHAFPGITGMGCKSVDHDDSTTTPNQPVCIGYELNNDLDFDTNGNGATYTVSADGAVVGDSGDLYYNAGRGWESLRGGFTAIFDGNGNTIANLFINGGGGLFGSIGWCDQNYGYGNCQGEVKNLGLLNAKVINGGWQVGTLAGAVLGTVTGCYADGGSVDTNLEATGLSNAGGLIGDMKIQGTITGSYANVTVTGNGPGTTRAGGLAGRNAGTITASYAAGDVRSNGGGYSGGLVGWNHGNGGTITASYATGSVYSEARNAGSLTGIYGSSNKVSITDSYGIGWVIRGVGNGEGLPDPQHSVGKPLGHRNDRRIRRRYQHRGPDHGGTAIAHHQHRHLR